ncbi:hypothetical protein D3C87_1548720 [compost metagenome]
MANRRIGHFQLTDEHVRRTYHRIKTVNGFCGQCTVGTGDDHDGVLTAVVDHNQRHAAGTVNGAHRPAIDLLGQQRPAQCLTISIIAHAADHRHLGSQPRCSHGLIGALATGDGGKRLTNQRFTALGQARGPGHQVHVQTANYHYFC